MFGFGANKKTAELSQADNVINDLTASVYEDALFKALQELKYLNDETPTRGGISIWLTLEEAVRIATENGRNLGEHYIPQADVNRWLHQAP